ncbi:MAG: MarR family transcriptional regulator [Salibacteraceae bacterium]
MGNIGDAIKQKEFKNEHNKLMINVLYTASWLNGLQNNIFKAHKLTPQQYNALRILRGQHPESASVNLLKDRMIDKMSNVSRIIDKLKAKELVTRTTCEHDRRQVDVKITVKGLKLLGVIDKDWANWEKNLHSISEDEAKEANGILDKWRT